MRHENLKFMNLPGDPSGAFYIIGVIMFLILCMCFPFIYGRDDNTLFVTCIYSVFTSYFFRHKFTLQHESQIRQARLKISRNNFRSISNCFNALMMMDHEISSINFKIIFLNIRGLNNSIKCRKIFKWLHRQTAQCFFPQEPLVPNNL